MFETKQAEMRTTKAARTTSSAPPEKDLKVMAVVSVDASKEVVSVVPDLIDAASASQTQHDLQIYTGVVSKTCVSGRRDEKGQLTALEANKRRRQARLPRLLRLPRLKDGRLSRRERQARQTRQPRPKGDRLSQR